MSENRPQLFKREEMIKVSKVAKRLGCSDQHVYNLINNGALTAFRFGRVKMLMVPSSSLDAFIAQSKFDPGA